MYFYYCAGHGSPAPASAHTGDICGIILPVPSYLHLPLSLHPFPPSLSLSLCVTFLQSSPADPTVLYSYPLKPLAALYLLTPPPHLLPQKAPTPLPHLLPQLNALSLAVPPPGSLGSSLSSPLLCSLQLYILCFLIRATHWLLLSASYSPISQPPLSLSLSLHPSLNLLTRIHRRAKRPRREVTMEGYKGIEGKEGKGNKARGASERITACLLTLVLLPPHPPPPHTHTPSCPFTSTHSTNTHSS